MPDWHALHSEEDAACCVVEPNVSSRCLFVLTVGQRRHQRFGRAHGPMQNCRSRQFRCSLVEKHAHSRSRAFLQLDCWRDSRFGCVA